MRLAMRLALAIGCTLGELGERMTAYEFGLWAAFDGVEPIGGQRGDLQAGVIAAAVANYAGKVRAESAGPASPLEFMPLAQPREVGPAPEEPDVFKHFSAIGR